MMQEDRVEMLRSLEIDRSAPPRRTGRPWLGMALALLVAAGAGAGGLYLLNPPATATGGPDVVVAPRTDIPMPDATPAAPTGTATAAAPQPAAPQTPAVPAVAATTARPAGALVASGYVVARRIATVSSENFGKITEVLVEEGMEVAEGQVLARLDDTLAVTDLSLAQARVATAEATLAGTRANLAEAERVSARQQRLSARDVSTEAALTQAQARVAVLKAELSRNEADLRVARLNVQRQQETLEKLTIRAPFAGVVVDKNAQPGEIISPSAAGGGFTRTGICTIVDMDSLEVEVDVNEAFIGRVAAGQRAEAVLDAYPDWKIPAQVIAVVPTANRDRATIKVRIALKEKSPRVLRDMAAKVTFFDRTEL